MGLFGKRRKEQQEERKATDWTLVGGYPAWFAGGGSYSGEAVSPQTAMQLTAVYGCAPFASEARQPAIGRIARSNDKKTDKAFMV